MFSRVLIANRGEIALRILRACKELGIQTICVFSEEDREAPYLRLADRAVCIGPGPAGESYLKIDRIIAAAEVANVDAIHPGYGFLAENAQFADACRDSKIEFIGPDAQSMRLLGDKIAAKKLARKSKVPTIPWTEGAIEDDGDAIRWAAKVGYPVMVKAAAGGGGGESGWFTTKPHCGTAYWRPEPRPKRPSKAPTSISKKPSRLRGTLKSRSWATGRATCCTSVNAIAACNGGTRS